MYISLMSSPLMAHRLSVCLLSLCVQWFLEGMGNVGLPKLLAGFEDKSAYAQCIFAFCHNDGTPEGRRPQVFSGRCNGRIVTARGQTSFGWDPIFQPDGFDGTFAELTPEQKNSVSHRYRALSSLRKYLTKAGVE